MLEALLARKLLIEQAETQAKEQLLHLAGHTTEINFWIEEAKKVAESEHTNIPEEVEPSAEETPFSSVE